MVESLSPILVGRLKSSLLYAGVVDKAMELESLIRIGDLSPFEFDWTKHPKDLSSLEILSDGAQSSSFDKIVTLATVTNLVSKITLIYYQVLVFLVILNSIIELGNHFKKSQFKQKFISSFNLLVPKYHDFLIPKIDHFLVD